VQPFGFNNSFVFQNGLSSVVNSVGSVNYTHDTFLGTDSTNNLSTVSLSSSSGYLLLADLIVSAPTNDVNVGEVYTLGLITSSDNTFFDQFGVPGSGVTVDGSIAGQLMITPSAVPEPSSIMIGLTGLAILSVCHGARRYRRQARPIPDGAA
jgi:hypothetical protein